MCALNSCSAVLEARASYEVSEASLGEVPDEFLDPVLCHLMRDPVLLPTSGTVMDRYVPTHVHCMRRLAAQTFFLFQLSTSDAREVDFAGYILLHVGWRG